MLNSLAIEKDTSLMKPTYRGLNIDVKNANLRIWIVLMCQQTDDLTIRLFDVRFQLATTQIIGRKLAQFLVSDTQEDRQLFSQVNTKTWIHARNDEVGGRGR